MPEEIKNFPNIPVMHWYNLRAQFKKSIPGNITPNYLMAVLDMTDISAKTNILPSLRLVGLIDNEGKINQELAKKFRDDEQYPKFCEETIKKVYPQGLLDAFPDKNVNRDRVKRWFMNHTSVGESAAARIVAFYIALVEANPTPVSPASTSKQKEVKPNATKVQVKSASKNVVTPKPETKTQETKQPENKPNSGPDLNINIQIHISSDASPDQIKSIFENMAKYIYKN